MSFDLKSARINRGLSLRQAALEVGLSGETFRKIEDGETVHPASAKKIADYFEIRVTDLMPTEDRSAA